MTDQNKSTAIIAEPIPENQEKSSTVCREAMQKIEKQSQSASGGNVPAIAIYHHLLDKCRDSESFATCVISDEKSVAGCFDHVIRHFYEIGEENGFTTVPGQENARCIGADGDAIFAAADEYFEKSDDEIKKERELKLAAIQERQKQEQAIRETERQKKEEAKKAAEKKKEEAKQQREEAKKNNEAQMSLFGGQDGDEE